MAHIFVANSSHQNIHFHYRMPETANHRSLVIPAGAQSRFPEDMNEQQLNSIIDQLQRYGAVPVSEIGAIVTPRALVFKVDNHQKLDPKNAIKSEQINEAMELEEKARQEIAAQELEKTGLAQFQAAGERGSIRETSLEVTELDSHGDPASGHAVDAEFVVSSKVGENTQATETRRRRRR